VRNLPPINLGLPACNFKNARCFSRLMLPTPILDLGSDSFAWLERILADSVRIIAEARRISRSVQLAIDVKEQVGTIQILLESGLGSHEN
jgi:hypothetical protein